MKKLYGIMFILLSISAFGYGQKKILFVGRDALGAFAADADQFDSLAVWGYVPEYIMSSDFSTSDITVYDGYDGIFFSETISSGHVTAFATHGYPLPAVNMEGYAPRSDRWGWITDNVTQFWQTENGLGTEDDKAIVIKDNSHYITQIFNVDDEVVWSTATGTDMAQNEPCSFMEVNVTFTNKLAKEKAHIASKPDFWTMITIDPSVTIPNKMFLWSMNAVGLDGDGQLLHLGTPEYYIILKRACDWTFDNMPESVPDNLKQVDYKLIAFPVPSSDQVTIRFNAPNPLPARVTLYNVAGQQLEILLEKSTKVGNNFIVLDANKYPGWMYYVRLEIEGRTEFAKIIIN